MIVNTPYPIFTDLDGEALNNGKIYIGTAGLDPIANPVQVYFDEALSITASQPISTQGGYPVRLGSPTNLYVAAGPVSMTVQNTFGQTVFTNPSVGEAPPAIITDGGVSVFEYLTEAEIADVEAGTALLNVTTNVQAAINDAADKGLALLFPSGVYLVGALTLPNNATGTLYLYGAQRAELRAASTGITVLSLGTDANRYGPRIVEGIRINGNDLANVTGIAVGGTGTATLYARLSNVTVIQCDEAVVTRNAQECIFEGLISFDNRVGFVAESSATDGGSTVLQFIGCRFQNNQVNFFGLSSSVFPIGGWMFNGCTFQTGFHSGVVLYGQTGGMGRLENVSMLNCHFEANVQGTPSDTITVRGKTFSKSTIRLVGADLSMSSTFVSTTASVVSILSEASNLSVDNSTLGSGQVTQFSTDETSRVFLDGRVLMTGSGGGIADWNGFDWRGGNGGGLWGVARIVPAYDIPNEYATTGIFPNAPNAGNQIGATLSKVLDKEQGLVQRVAYLASVGSTSANRAIIDALPMAFLQNDAGLVSFIVWSDTDTRMRFTLQGAASALATTSVLVTPTPKRVVMYGRAQADEAGGFEMFCYPEDDAGADVDFAKMMVLKRTTVQGFTDIVNVIRIGLYDDMLGAVYGDAIPTSGTWPRGKRIINRLPAAGQATAWVKVTVGSDNVLGTDWLVESTLP